MGLKTKWNRFRTLRNREGGFTLVELVVVIAILAILASVTVPAYNAYIEKAEMAADLVLADAVTVAFVAACGENAVDADNVSNASIRLSNGAVYGLSTFGMVTPVEGVTINTISEDFDYLYAGNGGAVFKSEGIQSLEWDPATECFTLSVNAAPARVQLANGNYVTVSDEVLSDLAASGLIDLGYDGMSDIMDRVDGSTEVLVTALGTTNLTADAFSRMTAAMTSNGLMSDAEAEAIALALQGKDNAYGYDRSTANERAANAMALCAAIAIADPDTNIENLMAVDFGDSAVDIASAYTSGIGGTAATAALSMQYAVVSTYAAANPDAKVTIGSGWVSRTVTLDELLNGSDSTLNEAACALVRNDPAAVMSLIRSSTANGDSISYEEYAASDNYNNDVNGIAAALGLLGSNVNKDNVDGVINVTGEGGYLAEGIESEDAKNLIETVLNTAAQGNATT